MRRRPPLAALAILGLAPLAAVAGERVAIRPGLWEMTHQTDVSGAPPVPAEVLAKMPPEARARMEAAMHGGGAARGHTARECITDKDLEHPFRPESERDSQCTHKILTQTSRSMEVELDCRSPHDAGTVSHGTFRWQATTPESMSGDIDMTTTQHDRTMKTHVKLSGKWLGADCGSVQPRRSQAN